MVYIRLKGGMGNQLFQYAVGRQLAHQLGTDLSMDLTNLLNRHKGADFVYRNYDLGLFNVKESFLFAPALLEAVYTIKHNRINQLTDKLAKWGRGFVKESHFHFQPSILENAKENTLYEGWFQSPRYFAGVEAQLREELTFKAAILPQSLALLSRIQDTAYSSICLNVRRTDFLKVDTLNATDLNYFLRGVDYLAGKLENPRFFIFSDDIEWCRENLKLPFPMEVVSHEHKGPKFGNYLQLMSKCAHFIIPNSFFAWWAAWLRNNPAGIVVTPLKWFTDPAINTSDLIPKRWIRL